MTRDPNDPAALARAELLEAMSQDVLAELGAGTVAYIRKLNRDDMNSLFPDMPESNDVASLWALLNADGTPIVVADSREAALANAFEYELEMASVH
ncbi:DUF1150 family protein [Roseibium aestuarii]|uniref:DUF1150 family protein n=1 Tax=Roseibium aestuarii TaxID=2600299 RepID=A0ABW4K0I5_9HYPH|nr:DUF1150 domain-containing protein [Roseibium aestuarii]